MNVGELFVNLGIKGSDKTVGALSTITKSLGETKSMSIEAKAAIAGAVYAFERMMSHSSQLGTNLVNLSANYDLNIKELQKWQWAALQAGESAEDFESNISNITKSVNDMVLNKSAPEYLGLISQKVKGFDPTKIRDSLYMFQKLNEFAQNTPASIGTSVLEHFGLTQDAIAGMHRNVFNPEMLKRAEGHVYSDNQVKSLDKANIAWKNLGYNIEMAFGKFNARHGQQLVGDIMKITNAVMHLVEALDQVATKFHVFDAIAKVTDFIANALNPKEGTLLSEKHGEKKLFDWLAHPKESKGAKEQADLYKQAGNVKPIWDQFNDTDKGKIAAPRVQQPLASSAGAQKNVDIKQTNHFHGDTRENAKRAADSMKKQMKDYVNQNSAVVQGS